LLHTASFASTDEDWDWGAAGLVIHSSIPLGARTFMDARLPLGIAMAGRSRPELGNASLGLRHVARLASKLWLTPGGGLGIPLMSVETQGAAIGSAAVPKAYWDLHENLANVMPLIMRFGLEGHAGIAIFRLDVDPVVCFAYGEREDTEFVLQKGFEMQLGHGFGGGLRIQGVALTGEGLMTEDGYQFAMEPFFRAEQELLYTRIGLMLPFDEELGPPFERSWGFRLGMGLRLD